MLGVRIESNKLISGITNISDKALIARYTVTPPRRLMDYQLMKITHETEDSII